jgi:hypothetical protein
MLKDGAKKFTGSGLNEAGLRNTLKMGRGKVHS